MNRISHLLVVVYIVLLSSPTAIATEYTLGPHDKIKITIYEWPNLSGEFRIGPDGDVSLPLIGIVRAGGLTSRNLAQRISERLQNTANLTDLPITTAEIVAYRPFYILGDVQQPGEYEYRPLMTVLQAVSIAGGIFRFNEEVGFQSARDAVTVAGDGRVLASQIARLLAQLARLQAEAAGRVIEFPSELVARVQELEIAELLQSERAIFEGRQEIFRRKSEGLLARRSMYERELLTIQAHRQTVEKTLQEMRAASVDVDGLVAKGLASITRQLDLVKDVADYQSKAQELKTLELQTEQKIAEVSDEMRNLGPDRLAGVLVDIQETGRQLQEARQRYDTASRLALQVSSELQSQGTQEFQRTLDYSITRMHAGRMETTPAAEETPVEPGDVIKVRSNVMKRLSRSPSWTAPEVAVARDSDDSRD